MIDALRHLHIYITLQGIINYSLFLLIDADALVLRITFISFAILGEFERMRDMFARSLVHWSEDLPLYPFVLGL